MLAEERRGSRHDPLNSYLEKRKLRLALAASRIAAGLAAGFLAGLFSGTACAAGLAGYAAAHYATYLWARRRLGPGEAATAGVVSALAAYLLGVFLGSALAA